ncbi:hypothetical protein PSTT_08707 [Puccinia striiformis]|uniref:Tet-like 2OG-Fe(II) oxygenase domain-containing protein n=1 Tax=Puccinia striiformis TaxID=27350 RepID=A0A2S4VBB9_9BASI|nr:hypothetical protein PSTT_08707 [Puccinia striiformis]
MALILVCPHSFKSGLQAEVMLRTLAHQGLRSSDHYPASLFSTNQAIPNPVIQTRKSENETNPLVKNRNPEVDPNIIAQTRRIQLSYAAVAKKAVGAKAGKGKAAQLPTRRSLRLLERANNLPIASSSSSNPVNNLPTPAHTTRLKNSLATVSLAGSATQAHLYPVHRSKPSYAAAVVATSSSKRPRSSIAGNTVAALPNVPGADATWSKVSLAGSATQARLSPVHCLKPTYAAVVVATAAPLAKQTINAPDTTEALSTLSTDLSNQPTQSSGQHNRRGSGSFKTTPISSDNEYDDPVPSPSHPKKKRKRKPYSQQNAHQRQRQSCNEKVTFIDLFPNITEELREDIAERKRLWNAYKLDPENLEEPPKSKIYARVPSPEENLSTLNFVKQTFRTISSGYHKIYDERTKEIVAMVEFIKLEDLSKEQRTDLDFLCLFLHRCKKFISPVGSKSRKCGGIMWAVGWRKGYEGLEILGRYRHQKAIDANPLGFENLMKDSVLAGEVVFKIFYGFGDVAVKKNQAYMNNLLIPSFADCNFPKVPGDKSPFGFASNLAFSSHSFYNHHHKDDGDASELPLAFALIIPTSRLTGKIATHHDGYEKFIFRDIQVALDFQPDTICRMIFWAQEYVHGTLYPTEPSFFTKLGLSLQVATKASNVCKKYLNGEYDDDSDKYFGGVDELLGN